MPDLQSEVYLKLRPPQPGEVYKVVDNSVTMNDQNKEDKKERPVLIVSNNKLTIPGCDIINVVPLTSKGKPDLLRFPISDAYEEIEKDFEVASKSFALLQLYQPIHLNNFRDKCGRINANSYLAIQYSIAVNVIGYQTFDLNP